jgi:CxxC motif-containing protein
MIWPTLLVEILDRGKHNRYGEPELTSKGKIKVAPVKLQFTDETTTVRTDSSGTHGSARETTADVVVLVPVTAPIEQGDVLVVLGRQVLVAGVHPRFTVTGKHDHNQVSCTAWAPPAED